MGKIRFIHTADLHIDTPFKGLGSLPETIFEQIKNSTFQSFERIVNHAMEKAVDFILIAGDLYDGSTRSLKGQLFLQKQFKRLEDSQIQVFIIHGNHDHLSGSWIELNWPENVHFFGSHHPDVIPYKKDGETLAHIYGYSYPERAVFDNIAVQYTVTEGAPFHIAMLHGTSDGNTEHASYAPFSLNDLIEKPIDYWALGHIHKRDELCQEPYVIYPGNIQGLNRKETGKKGCYLVEMTDGETDFEFIETSPIVWNDVCLNIDTVERMDDLLIQLHSLKDQFRSNETSTLLSIELSGSSQLREALQENETLEDLIHDLQEDEEEEESFVWINSIVFRSAYAKGWTEEFADAHFMNEVMNVFEEMEDLKPVLETLKKNRKVRKLLDEEDLNEKEIIEAAKHLLIDSVHRTS